MGPAKQVMQPQFHFGVGRPESQDTFRPCVELHIPDTVRRPRVPTIRAQFANRANSFAICTAIVRTFAADSCVYKRQHPVPAFPVARTSSAAKIDNSGPLPHNSRRRAARRSLEANTEIAALKIRVPGAQGDSMALRCRAVPHQGRCFDFHQISILYVLNAKAATDSGPL